MSHGLQIALSIAAGLGIGGWITGLLDRRHASREADKARDHASAEARAARRFQIYFDSYKAISVHLERVRGWLTFTEPLIGPGPPPPELNVDDALYELTGTVAVTATETVRAMLDVSVAAVRAFEYAVAEWQAEPVEGWSDDPEGRTPRKKLEDAREAAHKAINDTQDAMRAELTSV